MSGDTLTKSAQKKRGERKKMLKFAIYSYTLDLIVIIFVIYFDSFSAKRINSIAQLALRVNTWTMTDAKWLVKKLIPERERKKWLYICCAFAPHSKRINNRWNCEMLLSIALASSLLRVYNQRNRAKQKNYLMFKCLRLPIHIEFTIENIRPTIKSHMSLNNETQTKEKKRTHPKQYWKWSQCGCRHTSRSSGQTMMNYLFIIARPKNRSPFSIHSATAKLLVLQFFENTGEGNRHGQCINKFICSVCCVLQLLRHEHRTRKIRLDDKICGIFCIHNKNWRYENAVQLWSEKKAHNDQK